MARLIPFVKMQAVGNDFVLVDGRDVGRRDLTRLARRMCDRRFGIGGDGLVTVSKSRVADFRYRMFNPDGTEDFSGNGLRCAIKFWLDRHVRHVRNGRVRVQVEAPRREGCAIGAMAWLRKHTVTRVTVAMGAPIFDPKLIPLARKSELVNAPVSVLGGKFRMTSLSTGTAHTVIFVKGDPLRRPIPPISAAIETHSLFPERTSVLWTYVRNRQELRIRVWERGVGETIGCGTGACAAAVAAARLGLAGRRVKVVSKGGMLRVNWLASGETLVIGGAVEVFRGRWLTN